MRIAILTNAFPPAARGGAGQIADLQARWLVARGHEVHVFTVEPFDAGPDAEIEVAVFKSRTSVKFASLGKTAAPLRLLFHLEDLAPNLGAVDAIRDWRPDVLVSHNVTGCGWGTPRILKDSGVRWVHVLHDVQMFEPSGQRLYGEGKYWLKRQWRKFWANRRKRAFGSPDAVISPTRWLLEQHRSHGLFAGVETRILPNPMPTLTATDQSAVGSEDFLYIGRMAHDKGVDLLVEAWRGLDPKPGRLGMVGDGPLREICGSLGHEGIVCHGALEHGVAMERLAAASLLVMPSLVLENQPTVLLEAMSLGKLVIASDVGGVRETLDGYGKLYTPGNVTELSNALRDAQSMGVDAEARRRLLERHDTDRVMECFEEILKTN